MPFGEDLGAGVGPRTENLKYSAFGTDRVRQRFTGYERDGETQLDFAEARYYYNNHGRFTAVDPLLASGKSADPQTFNRYAYTMNRPLILTDPTGLQAATNPNQDKPIQNQVTRRSDNIKDREIDESLAKIYTDTGIVVGASAFVNPISEHHQFQNGQLHTIHVFGDESGDTLAGVYIPREYSDVKITSRDTVVATNPETGEVILVDHVQVGDRERGSKTNKTLRENMKTVRENGTVYIGQIGGEGAESKGGRHSHLTKYASEEDRLKAHNIKHGGKSANNANPSTDHRSENAQLFGDFRDDVRRPGDQ